MQLRDYLHYERIRQQDFALMCDIHFVTLNKIVHGQRKATLEQACRIERATTGKVTVYDLLPERFTDKKLCKITITGEKA